jgi:hypothetical protein
MLRLRSTMLSAAVFAVAAVACAQTPANCKITYISQSGNKYGLAPEGINQFGTIVGFSHQNAPTNFIRYNDGTFGKITVAGAAYTVAMRRNSSGTTVGYYIPTGQKNFFTNRQGFLNANGTTSPLKYPNSLMTAALGINKYGTIVGSFIPLNSSTSNPSGGFLYKNGVWTRVGKVDVISSINDSGTMVGTQTTKDGNEGIVYASPTATEQVVIYPGSDDTEFTDINNAGYVVGTHDTSTSSRGLVYNSKTGTFYRFDVPNAVETFLTGINSANTVVGYAFFQNSTGTYTRGFYAPCTF